MKLITSALATFFTICTLAQANTLNLEEHRLNCEYDKDFRITHQFKCSLRMKLPTAKCGDINTFVQNGDPIFQRTTYSDTLCFDRDVEDPVELCRSLAEGQQNTIKRSFNCQGSSQVEEVHFTVKELVKIEKQEIYNKPGVFSELGQYRVIDRGSLK